jgi:hypothetical protein
MTDSIEKRALTWASGDDTGVSSKAILKVMTGQTISDDYCHPHDSQDLGRCVRLLDIIPEWRPRIARKATTPSTPASKRLSDLSRMPAATLFGWVTRLRSSSESAADDLAS